MNQQYDLAEKRVIAFVDLLGFKDIIKNNETDKINNILKIIYEVKEMRAKSNPSYNSVDKKNAAQDGYSPDFFSSSDHMVISAPAKFSQNTSVPYLKEALDAVILFVNGLQISLLQYGVAVRGAIAFGEVYYDAEHDIVIGKPLIEAVEYEQNIAIYPRIIITETLLKELKTYWKATAASKLTSKKIDFLHPSLAMDFDGIYFIDYFNDLFGQSLTNLEFRKALLEIKMHIQNNLANSRNQKNLAKWCWIANYFNTYLHIAKKREPNIFYSIDFLNLSYPIMKFNE